MSEQHKTTADTEADEFQKLVAKALAESRAAADALKVLARDFLDIEPSDAHRILGLWKRQDRLIYDLRCALHDMAILPKDEPHDDL